MRRRDRITLAIDQAAVRVGRSPVFGTDDRLKREVAATQRRETTETQAAQHLQRRAAECHVAGKRAAEAAARERAAAAAAVLARELDQRHRNRIHANLATGSWADRLEVQQGSGVTRYVEPGRELAALQASTRLIVRCVEGSGYDSVCWTWLDRQEPPDDRTVHIWVAAADGPRPLTWLLVAVTGVWSEQPTGAALEALQAIAAAPSSPGGTLTYDPAYAARLCVWLGDARPDGNTRSPFFSLVHSWMRSPADMVDCDADLSELGRRRAGTDPWRDARAAAGIYVNTRPPTYGGSGSVRTVSGGGFETNRRRH